MTTRVIRVCSGRPERWVDDPPPGGWVCAVPIPNGPGGLYGMPVESEPCTVHFPQVTGSAEYDPGPVPEVVEPETGRRVTTIPVSSSVGLIVTENVGSTGRTGLTLMTGTGEAITAALDARAVDDLVAALASAVPVPYLAGGGR